MKVIVNERTQSFVPLIIKGIQTKESVDISSDTAVAKEAIKRRKERGKAERNSFKKSGTFYLKKL